MRQYTPDRWVVLEFVTPDETFQKVFAGWYGGFTQGDSWKLNSGITETRKDGDLFEFDGYSGSTYVCHSSGYGMSAYMASVLANWQDQAFERGDIQINVLDLEDVTVS